MDRTATNDMCGLIVMGGRSTRMGFNKSMIPYHGKPQCQYLYELLNELLPETYLSVRKDQEGIFTDKIIIDAFDARGPLNGLLSAHKTFPEKAWLVLAVDMPFITPQTILQLIENRETDGLATVFARAQGGRPEPLAAIWEARALAILTGHHLKGEEVYPLNFLQNNKVRVLHPKEDIELFNVNNLSDFEQAKSVIERLK